MIKKRKIKLTINICFLVYLLIYTICCSIYNFNNPPIEDMQQFLDLKATNIYLYTALAILSGAIEAVFDNMLIVIGFIAIKIGMRASKRIKMTELDFKKYKGYYRDVVKDYSPAVLSFIDDYRADENKDIVATLLLLKLKKHIDINDNGISILNNTIQEKLSESEKYILNNFENYDINKFNKLVMKDGVNRGLLEVHTDIGKKILRNIVILFFAPFIGGIFSMIISFFIPNGTYEGWSLYSVLICINLLLGGVPFIISLFKIPYLIGIATQHAKQPYIRTKKGKEVHEMLEGLKNYIKDFSTLEQRKKEEIVLWEDYLIYSVLFNQNRKIVQEFEKLLKK